MKRYLVLMLAAVLAGAVFSYGCSSGTSGGGGGGDDTTTGATVATLTLGDFSTATLSQSTMTSTGGTITSPGISGFSITVPASAVPADETITFTVKSADVTAASGLPTGTAAGSRLFRIETNGSEAWNQYRMFNLGVMVTLPYTAVASGNDIPAFYVYNADGTLEPVGFESIDKTNNTITFYVRTFANSGENAVFASASAEEEKDSFVKVSPAPNPFADFVAVGVQALFFSWVADGATVNTDFTPGADGWYIVNAGSYYAPSRGGNCHGMVSFAKYYFRVFGTGLYTKYRDADNTSTWVDDATAIELASRAQGAEAAVWDQVASTDLSTQTPSSRDVALAYVGGMYVTNQPVLLYIKQRTQQADGTYISTGAHAIMVYRADITAGGNISFYVYDPNFPNDSARRISYTDGVGFTNYASGTTAQSSTFSYNYFKMMGYNLGASDQAMKGLKDDADQNFAGTTVFPTIVITSMVGTNNSENVLANTGTTEEGEAKYITSDTSVTVTGTVLGGKAQVAGSVVDNMNIMIASDAVEAAIDNVAGGGTGIFSVNVPIPTGENEVVYLASGPNSYEYWAAFDRMIVESTASTQALTITLDWAQGSSDIDLYVQEPDFSIGATSYVGDTVYYAHRDGTSATHPYLDYDNTTGYGPEHYIAVDGMTTLATNIVTENPDGLYGTYKFKVHYYADYDADTEEVQPINWNINYEYLAYCPAPCTNPKMQGFWVNGAAAGSLTEDNSGNCCNINNTGPDWSSEYEIEYLEPNPADWVIPASTTVMLP